MNQIKRITAFLLTFIMCLQVMAFSAFAGSKISINNIMLCLETIAIDDSAMVSLRDIYQCFGATITWQADTQEIVVENTDKTIKFKVDSATAIINDVSVSLSHAVVKQNGVTYIPINFVSTSLDIPIKWNIEDGIVEFTISPDQTQAVNDRNNKLAAEKEKQRQAKIARQQAEIQNLRLAASQSAQNGYIDAIGNSIVARLQQPTPQPAYVVPAPYPYCGNNYNCCGGNWNNGCCA